METLKNKSLRWLFALSTAGALTLSACAVVPVSSEVNGARGGGNGQAIGQGNGYRGGAGAFVVSNQGDIERNAMGMMIASVAPSNLSETDKASITYMREEEKLARDVYQTLATKWNLQIFSNIARSEQTHMDALKTLLDRYGLTDPANAKAIGQFTNPELQKLYTDLVAQGSASLEAALRVGATIEDLDIADLNNRHTDKADVQLVFDNLTKGSRNHIRSFRSQLKSVTGVDYQPQFISLTDYNAILSSGIERGPAR